jgi:hypothetical protein
MTKEPNVVFKTKINTNDMNGTVGVNEGTKAISGALKFFRETTMHRDREATILDITSRKTRKENCVEIEITAYCQFNPSITKLKMASNWAGYGRWA